MSAPGNGLGRARLNLLRLAYAPLAIGLPLFMWPSLAEIGPASPHMGAVVICMLSTLGLLAIIGLFKPLAMLPLLLFEVAWKLAWLALVGIPAWLSGSMTLAVAGSLFDCALVAVIVPLVPWDHVVRRYLRPSRTPDSPRGAGLSRAG